MSRQSVRVVDGGNGAALVETYDTDTLQVLDRRPFGYGGRGPIPLPVSIVIRTLNEERLLGATLQAIGAQLGGWGDGGQVQVIVVDSGSSDRTVAIASSSRADIIQIPQASFTYGRALNIGVGASRGDIVVLLSAHAPPATTLWLSNLVVPFTIDRGLAGVFGRDIQWPDASTADRLAAGFRITNTDRPRFISLDGAAFSNANGAVRRSVAQAIPFCESVPSSEDAIWATAVLRLGWRVLYAPGAAVWHSHYNKLFDLARQTTRAVFARTQAASGACPTPAAAGFT